jgi:hypothetical protein
MREASVRITGYFSAAVAAFMVAGCGGGTASSESSGFSPQALFASVKPQAAALSIMAYGSPAWAADQLIGFGEAQFPQFFYSQYFNGDVYEFPFVYRYYNSSGDYLGVVVDGGTAFPQYGVYIMGKSWGQTPQYVGQLTDFVAPQSTGLDTGIYTGPVVDPYVGTWKYCYSPLDGRQGFTVVLTKINDTQLSVTRSRYLYPTVDCSGPPSTVLSTDAPYTITFGSTVKTAGWTMDRYVSPGGTKRVMLIAGGGMYFDGYLGTDASGYPTVPGLGPYVRQQTSVGTSSAETSGVTSPVSRPSITVGDGS